MFVGHANQMARYRTLLKSASTPELPVLRSRLLRRVDKRPSLWSAGTKRCGFRWAGVVQTTNRAASQARGILIRKMRPFEESYTFALMIGPCVSVMQ
jgi:hypothetical protein